MMQRLEFTPEEQARENKWAQERFEGEVKHLLRLKANGRGDLIKRVLDKRKEPYKTKLINECRIQWESGNRGNK